MWLLVFFMADTALGEFGIAGLMAGTAERMTSLLKGFQFLFHGCIGTVMTAFTRDYGLVGAERRQPALCILAVVAAGALQAGLMAAMGKKGGFRLFSAVKL